MRLEEKVAFLQRPDVYPDHPGRVESIETHRAWVFLTDYYAWKLKKPVRTPDLDFSTVEARLLNCRREVELNRRLAPGVYLGVVALTLGTAGNLRLGDPAAGESIVDWLVQMRRLPRERMLDALIAAKVLIPADLNAAAAMLASFYARAPRCELDGPQYRQRLLDQINENWRELVDVGFGIPFDAADALLHEQARFVETAAGLLDERVAAGRVIEAHGDLRPEHICLIPRPVIIDRLEFNRELRLMDCASELMFLALECERLGAGWVGRTFFEAYVQNSGDRPPGALLSFYRNWHACTRALLALLHLRDGDQREPDKWIHRARHYLDLAQSHWDGFEDRS